ncbi:hypothetical protein chiPu_0018885 [Chiloscyllium punctatum]|uniref:Uncharacterized protein n=1 Tax=Chiloscyllium punctatum TaxID=137246 RepID=A0A401RQB1_CHIPU|nr:hypothetical protein [Chiloscyllium punctatum]
MEQSGWEASRKNNLPTASFTTTSCDKSLGCTCLKPATKVHLGPDRDSDLETLPPTLHGAETGHPSQGAGSPYKTDDTDNVEEGTVRAAHPAVEISITTQTFYNKSYRDIKQGIDMKKTINETGEETADATAFMEGVVIEPVCDRTSVSDPLSCRWAVLQGLRHPLPHSESV